MSKDSKDKASFKPGQQVLRRIRGRTGYGAAFTVHVCELVCGEWVVLDLHLNAFKANQCVCAAAYNSPLWGSMQEDNDS